MKRFSERRPLVVGGVTVVVVALVGWFALLSPRLLAHRTTYHAMLAEAGGLLPKDEVRISGVNVGTVSGMKIVGDHVELTFTVDSDVRLGRDTRVDVGVLSPLGNEYVAVTPRGDGRLGSKDVIAPDHTFVPKTLVETFDQAGRVSGQIDTKQLATALADAGAVAGSSSAQAHQALTAVATLSQSVAAHSAQLGTLLQYGTQVTTTLNARRADLVAILAQGDQVLQVVNARRAAIAQLLSSVTTLSQQLSVVLSTNETQIRPLLANLAQVSQVLGADDAQLAQLVPRLAAFSRYTANATGNGLYTDLLAPTLLIPDNLIAACTTSGCPQ